MSEKQGSRLDKIVNVGLLVVIGFLLLGPRSYLRTAFDTWRAKARTANLLEENWASLAATTSRMHGVDGVPVWLVEFGDYECPFCRGAHPVLEKLAEQNPHVTIAYRHYPLSDIHPKAEEAARRLGDALGVTVTPTFFYQFGMQRGYLDEDQLTELLHAVTLDGMP